MIQSISVVNYLGKEIGVTLSKPEETGFIITDCTGLGPPKANINMTEITTNDGAIYNSARANTRNIVLYLRFLNYPEATIETIRQESYKWFPIKKPIIFRVTSDNRISEIVGYVESNNPVIFSKEESTQISIICPNPYFYRTTPEVVTFFGVDPLFEFIFSNESLTEPLLEMGEIRQYTEQTIFYEGDAEVGITITLHAIGDVRNITIYNSGTREVMRINSDRITEITGEGIHAADDIIINTVKGSKYILLIREGVSYNIINALDRTTDWFQLAKGDNVFAFVCEEGTENLQFKVEFNILYEGV